MKFIKFLTLVTTLGTLGCISFNITYDRVSATVEKEAEERKKNEVVIRPLIIEEDEIKENKIEESKEDKDEHKKEQLNVKTDNFIFIGDSRLETLKNISDNTNVTSAKYITSKYADCDWMRNTGLSELNHILTTSPGYYNIIFSPGINDLYNINRYVDFFNYMANHHENQNIFVLGVTPLDEIKIAENYIATINNDNIYEFNIDIMKNINDNVHMIYAFQELILNGYETIDGFYLNEDSSIYLLNFILNHVKSLQP